MVQTARFGIGTHSTVAERSELERLVLDADRDGLDLFSLSDHPYAGSRLDAYASVSFLLGRTQQITGFVNVSNLPLRPAPLLARTVTSLSALSGGRVVLGLGAGGVPERIADMSGPALTPWDAVDAFEEAMELIKAVSGAGSPVTFEGRHYHLNRIEPAPIDAPSIWTGSNGPRSLAATGRHADGWIPGHAADWLSPTYRDSRPIIDDAATDAGRDPSDIVTIFNLPGRIAAQPLPETRGDDGRWIGGSVDQWIAELTGAIVDHNAAGSVLFSPRGGTPDSRSAAIWANEIAPAVRSATGAQGS